MAILYAQTASKQTHPDYNIKAIKLLDSIIAKDRSIPTKSHSEKEVETKSLTIQLQKQLYNNENVELLCVIKTHDNIIIPITRFQMPLQPIYRCT
jgi:hypothetical protein